MAANTWTGTFNYSGTDSSDSHYVTFQNAQVDVFCPACGKTRTFNPDSYRPVSRLKCQGCELSFMAKEFLETPPIDNSALMSHLAQR